MSSVYVPYVDDQPAAIRIKGHKILILAASSDDIDPQLSTLGGQEVRKVDLGEDDSEILADLAAEVNGGVVVTPAGTSVNSMIEELERDLPWLQ